MYTCTHVTLYDDMCLYTYIYIIDTFTYVNVWHKISGFRLPHPEGPSLKSRMSPTNSWAAP